MFQNCCQADDALVTVHGKQHGRFRGKLQAETQDRYVFSVFKCNLKHERHLQPSLPSQRGMYMSYAVSQEVANMVAAGAKPAAIINYLTRSGQKGMVTACKVNNVRATIESDISVYSIRPSSKESQCQSLLNMLDTRRREKKDMDYIFLYTEFQEDIATGIAAGDEDIVKFTHIRMQTGAGYDDGLRAGDETPAPSSWLATLSHFFKDRWSQLSAAVHVPPARDKKKIHGFQQTE